MGRIASQGLGLRIDNEIEMLQRDLTEQVGHVFIDVDHVEMTVAIHEFDPHRFVNIPYPIAVRRARGDGADLFLAEIIPVRARSKKSPLQALKEAEALTAKDSDYSGKASGYVRELRADQRAWGESTPA